MSASVPRIVTTNHLEFDVSLYLNHSVIRDEGDRTRPLANVSQDEHNRFRLDFGTTLGGTLRIYMTYEQAMELSTALLKAINTKLVKDQEAFGG